VKKLVLRDETGAFFRSAFSNRQENYVFTPALSPVAIADYDQHINDTLDVIATIPGKAWPKSIMS
jgi:hypothetical protein